MLGQGLYILAGAPKVGKSWLALDLCLSVAKGEPFLKRNTEQGYVAYLSLEDIGNNLNQIALLGNMGRLKSVRLDELIEQHTAATKVLCDIAKAVK